MLDIVTMVFESTSMRYETLVARFWLRVRRVPQSSCRRQSRDKRQELWGRECPNQGKKTYLEVLSRFGLERDFLNNGRRFG